MQNFNEVAGRAVHEANRAIQRMTGEELNPPWDEAPDWMRESTRKGIEGVLEGNTPEQSHEAWCKARTADGWRWGPVKNIEAKIHPCLVPYERLPELQRLKDNIFVAVVEALWASTVPEDPRVDFGEPLQ